MLRVPSPCVYENALTARKKLDIGGLRGCERSGQFRRTHTVKDRDGRVTRNDWGRHDKFVQVVPSTGEFATETERLRWQR